MTEHYTVAKLRERGWSPAMIRALLGPPDRLASNPMFRSAAPMPLYETERVLIAEESEAFAGLRDRAERRSRAALLAADRRRDETLRRIARVPITVPVVGWDVLTRQAVAHRNRLDAERAWDRPDHIPAPAREGEVDEPTLQRWVVNYLRHELTAYNSELEGLFGRVGQAAGMRLLRQRIYEAIPRVYPRLTDECRRQLHSRESPSSDAIGIGRWQPDPGDRDA
ncbi:hypothetical protein [Nonomuraea sp. C10]|uniref:hypothetical protein n=1 Tax=Nonomuraea sp. C10 TaxID=2600577 RepID=UPI0016505087|nr:hypothetical protein [Nonomuraea sp. C10]